MKSMKNKGMAFVTVLIAVMFIGLLATSLAFMAYNNYVAKATRWQSSDNFYYDEFSLEEISSGIRQYGEDYISTTPTASLTGDTASDFIIGMAKGAGVVDASGASDNGNYGGNFTGTWAPASLQNLLNTYGITNDATSSVEITISASTIPGRTDCTYIRKGKDITYKNVCLNVLDKATNYTTTITTDIHFPSVQLKGDGIPVNEFSLMSDRPLKWTNGGISSFTGNVFVIDKATPPHNTTALLADKGANVQLMGKQNLIVGNVEVKGGSILTIGGEATITGTLTVEAGSMVQFNGNDVIVGSLVNHGTISGYVEEDATLSTRASEVFSGAANDTYSVGLASAICEDVEVITAVKKVTNPTTGAVTIKYATTRFMKTDATHSEGTHEYDAGFDGKKNIVVANKYGSIAAMASLKGNDIQQDALSNPAEIADIRVRADSDDITGATNQLLFLPRNNNNIRGDYNNTTIIASYGGSVQSDDPTTAPLITKLKDSDYNKCLNTYVDTNKIPGYDGWSWNTGKLPLHYGNTSFSADKASLESNTNIFKPSYTHLASGDGRTLYCDISNTSSPINYLPWGYFIRSDADEVIGFAFDKIRDGSSNGGEFNICYENWVKE